MVITGKRTWGGALKIMDRMYGIWDYAAGEWWKGFAGGRVTYKHYDNAVERAKGLNDGTYVTKYVGKDSGPAAYCRLIDPTDQVSSHWFKLPTTITLKARRPWGEPRAPKELRLTDDAHRFLDGFFTVEHYHWVRDEDGRFVDQTIIMESKWGWSVEIKVSEWEKDQETVHYHRTEKLAKWLETREKMHKSLTNERDTLMVDITDRETGCYGNHWEPEPDKEADTWTYEVEYGEHVKQTDCNHEWRWK
jgi:hypothetical protein